MAVDVQVTLSISATSCFIFSQVLNKCILSKKISYLLSRVRLFATPWTVACQAPLSMEFSRQEYQSGLPFPSPGDLPDPGVEARPPASPAASLPSEPKSSVKFSVPVTMALHI